MMLNCSSGKPTYMNDLIMNDLFSVSCLYLLN
jgi:hypothetical protein